jgi:hypothetical protein
MYFCYYDVMEIYGNKEHDIIHEDANIALSSQIPIALLIYLPIRCIISATLMVGKINESDEAYVEWCKQWLDLCCQVKAEW